MADGLTISPAYFQALPMRTFANQGKRILLTAPEGHENCRRSNMRWNKEAMKNLESNPKIESFLKAIDDVCREHGFSIAHEDSGGGFMIERYSKKRRDWLFDASDDTAQDYYE
jgi:hypothetical protein